MGISGAVNLRIHSAKRALIWPRRRDLSTQVAGDIDAFGNFDVQVRTGATKGGVRAQVEVGYFVRGRSGLRR
jgi:hypothetical protein